MKDQIMLKSLVAFVLFLTGISYTNIAAAYSPNDNWYFIGTKNIGHIVDKDVIYLRSSDVRYERIELRTDRSNIDLNKCVIHFAGGGKQKVKLREDNRGGESHIIDLEGRARSIDKIVIWGSRDYGKVFKIFNKGTVEVWGKVAGQSSEWSDYDYYRSDEYDSNSRELEQARRELEEEQRRAEERVRRAEERRRAEEQVRRELEEERRRAEERVIRELEEERRRTEEQARRARAEDRRIGRERIRRQIEDEIRRELAYRDRDRRRDRRGRSTCPPRRRY